MPVSIPTPSLPDSRTSNNGASVAGTSVHGRYVPSGSVTPAAAFQVEDLIDISPSACLLFTDVVGYTALSESIADARTTMLMLHTLWTRVDELLAEHPYVMKLDVIGDALMAVSGGF